MGKEWHAMPRRPTLLAKSTGEHIALEPLVYVTDASLEYPVPSIFLVVCGAVGRQNLSYLQYIQSHLLTPVGYMMYRELKLQKNSTFCRRMIRPACNATFNNTPSIYHRGIYSPQGDCTETAIGVHLSSGFDNFSGEFDPCFTLQKRWISRRSMTHLRCGGIA